MGAVPFCKAVGGHVTRRGCCRAALRPPPGRTTRWRSSAWRARRPCRRRRRHVSSLPPVLTGLVSSLPGDERRARALPDSTPEADAADAGAGADALGLGARAGGEEEAAERGGLEPLEPLEPWVPHGGVPPLRYLAEVARAPTRPAPPRPAPPRPRAPRPARPAEFAAAWWAVTEVTAWAVTEVTAWAVTEVTALLSFPWRPHRARAALDSLPLPALGRCAAARAAALRRARVSRWPRRA